MGNVVLDDPVYKGYLGDFSYVVSSGSDGFVILYKGFDFDSICRVLGYVVMCEDSLFVLDVPGGLLDVVVGLRDCSVVERRNIYELYEYLQYDCSWKVVRRCLSGG